MADGAFHGSDSGFRQLWHENHGNFLLLFAGIILVFGGLLMTWSSDEPPQSTPVDFGTAQLPGVRSSVPDEDAAAADGENPQNSDVVTAVGDGPPPEGRSQLRVRVTGMSSDEGEVRVALYRSADEFNEIAAADAKATLEIRNQQALWEIEVPAGSPFAITAYHDQNGNGELDKNLLGIPSEEYGFTKGARSQRGVPPFENAAVIPEAGIVEVPLQIW